MTKTNQFVRTYKRPIDGYKRLDVDVDVFGLITLIFWPDGETATSRRIKGKLNLKTGAFEKPQGYVGRTERTISSSAVLDFVIAFNETIYVAELCVAVSHLRTREEARYAKHVEKWKEKLRSTVDTPGSFYPPVTFNADHLAFGVDFNEVGQPSTRPMPSTDPSTDPSPPPAPKEKRKRTYNFEVRVDGETAIGLTDWNATDVERLDINTRLRITYPGGKVMKAWVVWSTHGRPGRWNDWRYAGFDSEFPPDAMAALHAYMATFDVSKLVLGERTPEEVVDVYRKLMTADFRIYKAEMLKTDIKLSDLHSLPSWRASTLRLSTLKFKGK